MESKKQNVQNVRIEFIVTEAEFLDVEVDAGLSREEAIKEAIRLYESRELNECDFYAGDRISHELDSSCKDGWNVEEVE